MQRDDIVQVLKNTPIFKGMEKDFFIEAANLFSPLTLKRAQSIHNTTTTYFYIIAQGDIKVTFNDPYNGRSIVPFLLSQYDGFDIISLIDTKESTAEYVALEKTTLLQIKTYYLREWIETYRQIDINLLQLLAHMLRQLENFSESLVFYDVKTRLANLILTFALKEKKRMDKNEISLSPRLSHETLAQMIGSVRSVVTTSLQELKKDGVILDEKAHLIVKDLEKLKEKFAKTALLEML